MSQATADFIARFVQQNPEALLCFPSGETPTTTLQLLVHYGLHTNIDFSRCRFVGLDEWVGMDKHTLGSCQQYMYSHFFDLLQISKEQIHFFDATNPDLLNECKRMDTYIFHNGPIDLMLVGLGLNGHIGLNEPGVSLNAYSQVSTLDKVTKTVAQKYFPSHTPLQQGITLGLKHLLEAKNVILQASGSKKADILAKALEGEVSSQVPASVMQMHPNSHVMLDNEAASALKKSII
jgi:glucosamine-6-phosphate isomerase